MNLKKTAIAVTAALSITFSANAADIFDKSNANIVSDDGLIYDTTASTYSETGEWKKDGVGFMEREKRVTSSAEASAVWNDVRPGDNGYYEVYIWKNVIENGDKNAYINWFATGSSNGTNYMDCSEGESGWFYLGTCNTSDLAFKIEITPSGNGVLPICCFKLVKTNKEAYTNYLNNRFKQVLVLKIGSEKAIVNGETVALEMGKAVIANSRTMVPLRFVMQSMGADVVWDENTDTAKITLGEMVAEIGVGKGSFTVNGEEKALDSPAYISENRVMVPLRDLSEGFEKKVYWDESGIALIADEELDDFYSYVKQGQNL